MANPLHPRQRDLWNICETKKFVLAYGSSRGGKTYTFARFIIHRALQFDKSTHLVVRQTGSSIKNSCWPTFLAMLDEISDGYRQHCKINLTDLSIELHNESKVIFTGVNDEEHVQKILGAEYATIFLNEIVDIDYPTYEVLLSRLNCNWHDVNGQRCPLKLLADCNPKTKKHWVHDLWLKGIVPGTTRKLNKIEQYRSLHFDSEANPSVDPEYYENFQNSSLQAQQRFLRGRWTDEVQGALFQLDDIERNRRNPPDKSEFDLIVVSVDPATTSHDSSDETGIIVAGKIDGHVYALEDLSGRYRPEEWARIVADAYHRWGAGCVRIETNQGGDAMVFVLRAADPTLTIKTFHAAAGQGKNMRAQPVAAEMAAGRIHLPFEPMVELESQLASMTGDYDRKRSKSPDRLDALVYAVAELILSLKGPVNGFAAKAVGFWR